MEWVSFRIDTIPHSSQSSGDSDIRPCPRDIWHQRYYEIVEDLLNKGQIVDDTCQVSQSDSESFFQTCEYMTRCGEFGIILNPTNFQYCQEVVDFAVF